MTRPTDWSPLADADPVPGYVIGTAALRNHFTAVAETVATCTGRLTGDGGLSGQAADQHGLSIAALQEAGTGLSSKLTSAVARYQSTSAALQDFVTVLEEQQDVTRAALIEAQNAQADLDAANAAAHALTSTPEPTSATVADDLSARLSAYGTAARDAEERIIAARRRMDTARDVWEDAADLAAQRIEDAIRGDALKDRWYDHPTLRDVTGAIGEVLWNSGPDTVVDIAALAAALTPWDGDDDWADAFADWVGGGHDGLQNWWGTDTSSTTFQGVWIGGTLVVALIPFFGQGRAGVAIGARAGSKGMKVLEDTATDERSSPTWGFLQEMLPWYQAPTSASDSDQRGFLQGPAYVQGPLGDAFAPGTYGTFEGRDGAKEQAIADVLLGQGARVDARYQPDWNKNVMNPDAMVRDTGDDIGTPTEFKTLSSTATNPEGAAKANIRKVNSQLAAWGGGDGVVDGRAAGLTAEQAQNAVDANLRNTVKNGTTWKMADQYTFLLADESTLVIEVEDLATTSRIEENAR